MWILIYDKTRRGLSPLREIADKIKTLVEACDDFYGVEIIGVWNTQDDDGWDKDYPSVLHMPQICECLMDRGICRFKAQHMMELGDLKSIIGAKINRLKGDD